MDPEVILLFGPLEKYSASEVTTLWRYTNLLIIIIIIIDWLFSGQMNLDQLVPLKTNQGSVLVDVRDWGNFGTLKIMNLASYFRYHDARKSDIRLWLTAKC